MKNLLYLQEGLLKEDHSIVSGYINEIDLRTANEELVKAGEKFGFKTVMLFGQAYGWMAEISRVLGYGDPSSYRRLLEKWEVLMANIGWFGQKYRTSIRENLGINEKDSRALLIGWSGFLIGCIKGEGDNADAVFAYLLQCEREVRTNTVGQVKAEEHTMRKDLHRIKVLTKKIALCKAAGVNAPPAISEDFFQVTGVRLPANAQKKLFKDE